MKIKPIKNEQDYLETLEQIEKLIMAEPNSPEGDTLDILVTLVEAYEGKHYPILPPDPVEAIIHQMESQNLSRKDLEPFIGSRARVSEILNKKRALTLNMIRKLQIGLGISAEILVHPYQLNVS
ncbi:MAG: transcriptional regulator [Desulfobacterales bacterium]|nr:MAG: transcriptional regulator [Desulfobacterales bacterium]